MPETIKDGTGTGEELRVDKNHQLHTFAVTEGLEASANRLGDEFNLNTGIIAYTGSSDSSLIYFKNDESPVNGESGYFISGIVVGMGIRSTSVTDYGVLTIIRNPDAGDIISDATDVSFNSNSNFGSNRVLSSTTLVYKGKNGGTISGGTTHGIAFIGEGRNAIPLNMSIPKGSSIGLKIDINTSGGCNVYAALIGYRIDGNNRKDKRA